LIARPRRKCLGGNAAARFQNLIVQLPRFVLGTLKTGSGSRRGIGVRGAAQQIGAAICDAELLSALCLSLVKFI
jgi:hypothetical protein